MNRQEFIRGLAGAAAFGALPALAAKDCEIFYAPKPTPEELMDMPIMKKFHPTRLEIKVGAKKPFGLLHFSDSHIAMMNGYDLIRADEAEYRWYESDYKCFANAASGLAAALAYSKVKGLYRLHTGDLVDYLSNANVHYIENEFKNLPSMYAIGNHEYCGTNRPAPTDLKAARAKAEPWFPNGFTVHSTVIEGVNFVTFDNVGMCTDIADREIAALKAEFAKGLPTVLAYHIPFYTKDLADRLVADSHGNLKSVDDISEAYLAATPKWAVKKVNRFLASFLPKQKNLKAMLCGHLHFEYSGEFCEGVTQYVAGATYKGNAYEIRFC